jgi:hypothetical protein
MRFPKLLNTANMKAIMLPIDKIITNIRIIISMNKG